ncbi:MAG TPA: BON domain-containing protein [Methylomirabilota bacterium]|jgi:hyperosmotically inducible protein|nr:BON domain-containing protein [Methylomirabilota bacterium]
MSVAARIVLVIVLVVSAALTSTPIFARTVGEIIDDARIAGEVKAKLAAESLSNLASIDVTSDTGIVTLSGTVDSAERRARAAQIAGAVTGVKGLVNNIQVAGAAAPVPGTPPPAGAPAPGTAGSPSASPTATSASPSAPASGTESVDATGVVASVDAASGTITLTDGRILKTTPGTALWQPVTLSAVHAGTEVFVRGATPAGYQPVAAPTEWRMGTVSRVNAAANQLVLTDGTLVRVSPATSVLQGGRRVSLGDIHPGAEVVIRTPTAPTAAASPIDASEVSIVWAPTATAR